MGSLNKVTLIGNLGSDPEIVTFSNGGKAAKFSIATTERWKDRETSEARERTEWHRVVIYNEPLVGVAEQYLRKGKQVYIEGQLQTRKWTDDSGVEKYMTEVVLQRFRSELVLLGRRDEDGGGNTAYHHPPTSSASGGGASAPENSGANSGANAAPQQNAQQNAGTPPPMGNDLDDDVPF